MPVLTSILAAAAPELAQRGLHLLGGIFRGFGREGSAKQNQSAQAATGVDAPSQAQQVVQLIQERTGIEAADIAQNRLDDGQWSALKEFELEHESQLQAFQQQAAQHELELERVLNEDRANARAAGTARDQNQDPLVRRFPYIYAYVITGLTFVFIFAVVFFGPAKDSESWRVVDTVLGFLLGVGLSAVIQYFYGSSHGSKAKDEMLRNVTGSLGSEGR